MAFSRTKRRTWAAGAAIVGLALAVTRPGFAQANYRTAPIGGRSQLLGGTGMTYGMDASAGFLNPATAVLVDDSRLSFSVNFYILSIVHAPHWYTPGPIDRSKFGDLHFDHPSTTGVSFDALPSSLCLFFRAKDIAFLTGPQKNPRTREARIGFCAATIEKEEFGSSADGFGEVHAPLVSRQAQTVVQTFSRFAAGPTYSMYILDNLAVGASLHGNLGSHRSQMSGDAATFGGLPTPISSSFYRSSRGDSFDLTATAGATYQFGKQTVGISIRSPSVHVYGVGSINQSTSFAGAGSDTDLVTAKGSFVARSPMRIGIGTGIEAKWGQAEFNVFYTHQIGQAFSAQLDGHQTNTTNGTVNDHPVAYDLSERAKGVVDAALGVEFFTTRNLSVLSGISTDVSAVPQGRLGSSLFDYFPAETNRVSGSLGLASHGAGGEVIVGAEGSVGWGERLAVNNFQLPNILSPTGQANYQVIFVIAGTTSLRNVKRAYEDVREIVRDPKTEKKPQPAEDSTKSPEPIRKPPDPTQSPDPIHQK